MECVCLKLHFLLSHHLALKIRIVEHKYETGLSDELQRQLLPLP